MFGDNACQLGKLLEGASHLAGIGLPSYCTPSPELLSKKHVSGGALQHLIFSVTRRWHAPDLIGEVSVFNMPHVRHRCTCFYCSSYSMQCRSPMSVNSSSDVMCYSMECMCMPQCEVAKSTSTVTLQQNDNPTCDLLIISDCMQISVHM